MSDQWYVQSGDSQYGPFDSKQLRALAASGKLQPNHKVSRGDAGPWSPAANVKNLFATPTLPLSGPSVPDPPKAPPRPQPVVAELLVEVSCPSCGRAATVKEKQLGRTATCKCGSQFILTRQEVGNAPIVMATVVGRDEECEPPPIAAAVAEDNTAVESPKAGGLFGLVFGSKSADDGLIETYAVVYRGGHPEYPKEKAGKIAMKIFGDRFQLLPTMGSKGWFKGLVIPFERATQLEIVQRQVGTVEGLIGGLNSRQLNQANNIHLTYQDASHGEVLLRLEMLTGVTVMGQAKKCLEFMDRIRTHRIVEKFGAKAAQPAVSATQAEDIPKQIEKLAGLRDRGILSQQEFDQKKAALLARM